MQVQDALYYSSAEDVEEGCKEHSVTLATQGFTALGHLGVPERLAVMMNSTK